MRLNLSQIWKQWKIYFKEFLSEETIELGKTLKAQGTSLELLTPLMVQSSSLLDVLRLPKAQVVSTELPFVLIAIAMLRFYRDKTGQELTLEYCVAVVSQAAYLESFKEILALPENQSILANWDTKPSPKARQRFTAALQKLGDFELDHKVSRRAIASFGDSQLLQEFNQVLSARLQQARLNKEQAQNLTKQVALNSVRYFINALTEVDDYLKPIVELYRNIEIEVLNKYDSIEQYVEEKIAPKPNELVFNEIFTFRDIYVPLKARKVDSNGKLDEQIKPFDLETWAKTFLLYNTPIKQRQVMFIQGASGRGKSVFCRIFADWIWQYLYPKWTPILIRLRDIDEFQPRLEDTLRSRVKADFAQNNDNWLTDTHTRFLFLLDGLDELRIERKNNQSIEKFLRQVSKFQNDCQDNKNMGHRVLITGRATALHGIDHIPGNLKRVEITEIDAQSQQQWINNWQKKFDTDQTREFQQILQDKNLADNPIQKLAKEPLLLYMLAAMHRDNSLDINKFEQVTGITAKILIYQQALDWVLKKQRSDSRHPDSNDEITNQNPKALRRLLAEAAVCVLQAGGENASMQMVKARLQQDEEARKLIQISEKELGDEALTTALSAFHLESNSSGGVEFFHKSFREFLCAERLKQNLEKFTISQDFNFEVNQLHWQIYDLFGYGGLTSEIVEYIMGLLVTSHDFRPVQLFQFLEDFYRRWCHGEFINAVEENLPQKKTRQLQKHGIQLGQRQIDIYVGLNIMILLLELHRYGQQRDELKEKIAFYPCGQPESDDFDDEQLLRIIGYSYCISIGKFLETVGQFLSHVNLSKVNLSGTNLNLTSLNHANLKSANLKGTNLSRADLSHAELMHADLSGADLSGANLNDAYLNGANLSGADLSGADLNNANLRGADLSGADLTGVKLNNGNLSGALLSRVNLSGAYLSGAFLNGINLSGAHLNDVNLSGAFLSGANLSGTYLSGAYLSGVNLSGVNLRGANLSNAYLSGANLSGADLSNAYLSSANFSGTNLSRADLENISWDENTKWEDLRGLDTVMNVPAGLQKLLWGE